MPPIPAVVGRATRLLIVLGLVGTARPCLEAAGTERAQASSITQPAGASFFGLTPQFALSPDGAQIAFIGMTTGGPATLWVQPAPGGTARSLAGTEQASYPFWSPDGLSVGFFASGKLKTLRLTATSPTVVCDAPTGRGGTWNGANLIVFASGIGDPLRQVAAEGGTPVAITTVDTPRENSHRWPQFLPDGRHVMFWAGAGTGPAQLKIATLGSHEVATIGPSESNGAYAARHVFFKKGNALVAQPFDLVSLAAQGDPVEVASPISTDAGSAFASVSASLSGAVAYTRGSARPLVLTWFDRGGRVVGTAGEPGQYTNVNLSPDGSQLAVSLTSGTPANRDVWVLDLAGGGRSRLTTDPAVDATPTWSPDGRAVIFSSQRAGPYQMYRRVLTAAGAGDDERVLAADVATIATDWSADGRFIAFTRTGASTGLDVWVLPLDGDRQPIRMVETRAAEDNGAFSPDGRWIAYQSNASGRDEIYVKAFPPAAVDAIQISANGGTQPRWRGDGNELFFLAADGAIMAAPIASASSLTLGTLHTVLPAAMTLVIRHAYAVTRDGQRVLVPVLDQSNPPVVTVVPRWTAGAR